MGTVKIGDELVVLPSKKIITVAQVNASKDGHVQRRVLD